MFCKHLERDAVELAGRSEVAAERFLDDDAGLCGEACRAQAGNDGREQRRRNGQVMRRALCRAERALE